MREVQETLRKLKPIIGAQADRYWLAYLSEDARGRQELEIALSLLHARHLGGDVADAPVHLTPPPPASASGDYELGKTIYAGKETSTFGLREDELIQHTAIFGRSGAGKTNTVVCLIEQLLAHKKPFLIFDWKRNYRDLLAVHSEPILVHTVGRGTVPFVFNPLIPPEGTDPPVWLKKLIEIIAHAYYLGEGVMFLLQEAIHAVYEEYGVYGGRPDRYPTFDDVHAWLVKHPVKGRQALWMDSAMRGIKSICFGHMGTVVNTGVQPNLAKLMQQYAILELDGLSNADKTLITEALLLWLHHWRMTQPDRETFKHAIIIEEAHHILRKQTGGGAEAITETILREIRELGEAIILVDQHPSMIAIPALGNTYATITMNLKHRSDVSAIAAAMLMEDDEKEILGRLPIGEAVVKLQGRWPRPFQVKVPHRALPKGCIGDSELIQRMRELIDIVPNSPTEEETKQEQESPALDPTEAELSLLRDVAIHPLSGVVERYRRLRISRRKGNSLKETCLERDWLRPIDIPTRSGRVVLLDLTQSGQEHVRKTGIEIPDRSRWGSLEHEYWKRKVANRLENLGYVVKIEEPVNGYTDLIAEKDDQHVAVEIETGKSDWQANLTKNQKKGFDRIIIVATSEEAFRKLELPKETAESGVTICLAWEVEDTRNDSVFGPQDDRSE